MVVVAVSAAEAAAATKDDSIGTISEQWRVIPQPLRGARTLLMSLTHPAES